MIRRDDGDDWLLISQVDHAALASEVAGDWDLDALPLREQLLPTIRLHDAGWKTWERTPEIDPENGTPRNFTEMPLPVATEIWDACIATCREEIGPLGAYWASRHFARLAGFGLEHRAAADDLAAARSFITAQHERQQASRKEIRDVADELIETGFEYLVLFDRISLWLTMLGEAGEYAAELPGGKQFQFFIDSQRRVTCDPWPFLEGCRRYEVPARRVPARRYDAESWAEAFASGRIETLDWSVAR